MRRILITGDSTIDLSAELLEKYNVKTMPLYINMGDNSYKDGVDISPDDIYEYVKKTNTLPKTSAPSVEDYITFFKAARELADEVIHLNISACFSSAHQNALIAAEEVDGVYPFDSKNLSTGSALLVLEACDMVEEGKSTKKIIAELTDLTPKVEASFIINQLDYLAKGGRCSSLMALGANILKLRPVILVKDGQMDVGKKFRGKYDDCLQNYIESKLKDRTDIRKNRIFITHTKCEESTIKRAYDTVNACQSFDEILETTAGCTITNHCGENTLGVLFIHK